MQRLSSWRPKTRENSTNSWSTRNPLQKSRKKTQVSCSTYGQTKTSWLKNTAIMSPSRKICVRLSFRSRRQSNSRVENWLRTMSRL
jgi:hypothetical protein